MPTATIKISTSDGSLSPFTIQLVYNYFSANTWTSPGTTGGEWNSYSSADVIYLFNGPESKTAKVWLKLLKAQWDLSHDLPTGSTGVGVICATFKPVTWTVV